MSGPDWNDRHMSGDTIHPDRLAVTPPRALAALSALVASVANNDPDALTAYRSLLTQAADLATARPPHDTAIETALSVLGTYSGWGGRARELDATVKRLRKRADDARATLRLVDDGDEHVYPDLSSALSAAGVPQCPPGMSVPAGYRVLGERPHIVREVTTQDGPSLRSVAPRLLAITSIARNEVRAQRIREVLDVAGVGATYDVKRGAAGVRFADSGSILMWSAASTSTLWVVRSGVIQPGPWTEADVDDLIDLVMRTATLRQERERAKHLAEQQAKAAAERERAEAAWAAWKAGGGA